MSDKKKKKSFWERLMAFLKEVKISTGKLLRGDEGGPVNPPPKPPIG